MTVTANTRFRIDFLVQEVCDDGSVPQDELRSIRFGDDVSVDGIYGFFNRARDAVVMLFRPGPTAVAITDAGPNKIQVIKALRALTEWGLKEAKDMVEQGLGFDVVVSSNHDRIAKAKLQIEEAGAKAVMRPPSDSTRPSSIPNAVTLQ